MTLKVWIDGACEPINPGGTASYGLIIERPIPQVSFFHIEDCKIIGKGKEMSNNVAEYSALLAFLEWYLRTGKLTSLGILNYEPVEIMSDSQLLVNQMNGTWKAKSGLYLDYYKKAKNTIQIYGLHHRLTFKWIPREENQEADNLSKKVLNGKV